MWSYDRPVDANTFGQMVDSLAARGPDGRGVKILEDGRLALGHRRLSIIDLSESGAQPMTNEDGTIWLTFNGEIYNFRELREELIQAGHRFRSKTDSEVIVHAYEEWGDDCVKRLSGIFAFGIFDSRRARMLLARDPLGVKPLYVYEGVEGLIAASQPRAILDSTAGGAAPDFRGLSLYLAYGYIPSERTAFHGIRKLPAGCTMAIDRNGRRAITKKYWHFKHRTTIKSRNEAMAAIRECVVRCIERQTVSDVPIGIFLSGGIDSSVLAAVAADIQTAPPLQTFTLGFDVEGSDERKYARIIADYARTTHREDVLGLPEALDRLPGVVEAYDEPFTLTSAIPMFAVSQLAQRHHVKVILGGDGVDELFAGYLWYDRYVRRTAFRHARREKLRKLFGRPRADPVKIYFELRSYHSEAEVREILSSGGVAAAAAALDDPLRKAFLPRLPDIAAAQTMDVETFLVDHILNKVDRASMACGVECRVPYLDTELVELAFSIDPQHIYQEGERKSIFKSAVGDLIPAELLSTRKKGFSSPDQDWMKQGLAGVGRELLRDGYLMQNNIIDPDLAANRFGEDAGFSDTLVLGLELWARRWLGARNSSEIASAIATAVSRSPIRSDRANRLRH